MTAENGWQNYGPAVTVKEFEPKERSKEKTKEKKKKKRKRKSLAQLMSSELASRKRSIMNICQPVITFCNRLQAFALCTLQGDQSFSKRH